MNLDWLKVDGRAYLKDKDMRETVEDVVIDKQGYAGFRVAWIVEDHWANVWVWEISGFTDGDRSKPSFYYFDEDGHQEWVDTIEEAKEWYLDGFVKWDGCSQFDMGDQHLCGADDYKKHIALLEYIYKRAFELMGRPQEEEWGETHYL
jgi:hypothetical protein